MRTMFCCSLLVDATQRPLLCAELQWSTSIALETARNPGANAPAAHRTIMRTKHDHATACICTHVYSQQIHACVLQDRSEVSVRLCFHGPILVHCSSTDDGD